MTEEKSRYTTPEGYEVYCGFDEMLSIDEFKPHPNNPNIHPAEQLEVLAEVFKNTGIRQPIKISKLSGYIISGHGRLEAARLAGLSVYPAEYQNYTDENQEMADLLGDNKIAELSEIDADLLKHAIENTSLNDGELLKIGFTNDDLQKYFNPIDDDIPDGLELEKIKAGSTTQNFLQFGNKRVVLTDEENERLTDFLDKYAKANGNYLG